MESRKVLQVRLPESFYNGIKKEADRLGLTVSAYIRNFLFEYIQYGRL